MPLHIWQMYLVQCGISFHSTEKSINLKVSLIIRIFKSNSTVWLLLGFS